MTLSSRNAKTPPRRSAGVFHVPMKTSGVLVAVTLLLSACGGGDGAAAKPEPKPEPKISVEAACLLVEDDFVAAVDLMSETDYDPADADDARGYADTFQQGSDDVSDESFAAHLARLADGMDELAEIIEHPGSMDNTEFRASAAEVGSACF